jgi:hypothetical protein
MDLMRYIVGDARWCYARVAVVDKDRVRPAAKADIREGGEGMGPIAGDHITAMYGFDKGVVGHFASYKCARAKGEPDRFGLQILGTRGIIQLTTGTLPPVYCLHDPAWFPARDKAGWQEISSAGPGKPETLKQNTLGAGNIRIVRDLMEAIEKERQPKGNMYDGRAALEMILAVYESHRVRAAVDFPLKNRRHPLAT